MASFSKKKNSTDKQDKFKRKRDSKEPMSNNQLKKNLKKTERGPTKKELREEELMKKSKSKMSKSNSKLDKKQDEFKNQAKPQTKSQTESQSDSNTLKEKKPKKSFDSKKKSLDSKKKSFDSKKKSLDSKKLKEKKPRPIMKKKKTAKVFYTENNINSFLIEASKYETKDKAINMLLFVFKQFKSNPAEILSKLKILTSDKKIKSESEKIHERILQHLFTFFELKGTINENLLSMISQESLLSKYVCDFLFSNSFSVEDYNSYFNMICDEISKNTDKIASLSMNEYLECIGEMDKFEDLIEYKIDCELDDKTNDNNNCDHKETVQIIDENDEINNNENDEISSESTVSLISLNDDNEIERLDRELGNMFRKGVLSIEQEEYVKNLLMCLEILIKHNYAVKTDDLIKILYFCQFESASNLIKFIVKDFLKKINDKKRVFKIFQMSSLVVPSVYQFLNLFNNYCDDEFDLLNFLGCVFNFGHEDFIMTRIDRDKFYSVYDSSIGESFDNFFISLISIENRKDKLKELESQYFKPEIKEAILKKIK